MAAIKKTSLRKVIHDQLEMERPQIKGLSLTNWILVFIIIFSQVMYTVETEQELETGELNIYWFLDLLISGIFGIEFFSRIWVAGIDRRLRGLSGLFNYFKTNWFMLVVDFLAFAPELISVIIGVNPPSWLRSLRVFRLIKMVRYIPAVELVTKALRGCIQELLVALSLSIILWYLASVVLYLAESAVQPDHFGSITRAMWWSVVTLTTVGYGDVYPITVFGKVAAGIIAVIGVGTVALPGGIMAGAFIEEFRERRRQRKPETSANRDSDRKH